MSERDSRRRMSRRAFLGHTGALAGTALAGAPGALASRKDADLVLTDANVITQDPVRPRAEAVAIRGGLIQATGSTRDMLALAGKATDVIPVGGRTVIPGLNDSHMHPTRAGRFYALELRWDGVPTLEDGLNRIREQARRTPAGPRPTRRCRCCFSTARVF